MAQYWIVSSYHADRPMVWEKVWQFNLENSLISIGWKELGDISEYSKDGLKDAIEQTYLDSPPNIQTLYLNMLWSFYHEMTSGDIIIARRGRKVIAGIGTVTGPAYYEHQKNIEATGPENPYSNHIGVRWHDAQRDLVFQRVVFGMQTIYEITEDQYRSLVEEEDELDEEYENHVQDRTEFVLEKYLEDFIVANFSKIFRDRLELFADPVEGVIGQQYGTEIGPIDILAIDRSSNSLVVIELKKGRESDRVVGQILRYMGWVRLNLAREDQSVRGLIICRDSDPRLQYALSMVDNINVKYYEVDFRLADSPFA